MRNKTLLIMLLTLTMLSLCACDLSVKDEEVIVSTTDYYNEDNCKLTQRCEAGCNAVEKDRVKFCDYVCMEKKYCDPSK